MRTDSRINCLIGLPGQTCYHAILSKTIRFRVHLCFAFRQNDRVATVRPIYIVLGQPASIHRNDAARYIFSVAADKPERNCSDFLGRRGTPEWICARCICLGHL